MRASRLTRKQAQHGCHATNSPGSRDHSVTGKSAVRISIKSGNRVAGEEGSACHTGRGDLSADGCGSHYGQPWRWLQQRHRSEEHTSELQSLMRISYAVFCLKKKNHQYDQYTQII